MYITLSGSRVKSKRNRVVPVPEYVRKELIVGDRNHNIFSGDIEPYNRSYFNGVWKRFRALNPELDKDLHAIHLDTQAQYTSYKELWGIQV